VQVLPLSQGANYAHAPPWLTCMDVSMDEPSCVDSSKAGCSVSAEFESADVTVESR
jgi:hypothetical protein